MENKSIQVQQMETIWNLKTNKNLLAQIIKDTTLS